MLEIVNLSQYPSFFNVFVNHLYNEYKNTFFKNQTKRQVRSVYKKNMNNIYIAIKGDKFLGCYSIQNCLISDVYIVPSERSKGLGKIMMNHAKKKYCWKWGVYTTMKNAGFYEKMGFQMKHRKNNIYYMVAYNYTLIWFLAAILIGLLVLLIF